MAVSQLTGPVSRNHGAGDMISICAGCGCVELEAGDWDFAPRAAFPVIEARFSLAGSFCPDCAGDATPPAALPWLAAASWTNAPDT